MKYVVGILLLMLSALLGCIALMNIYFAMASAGKSQLNAAHKPNLPVQGIFALLAIALLIGGIAVLRRKQK